MAGGNAKGKFAADYVYRRAFNESANADERARVTPWEKRSDK